MLEMDMERLVREYLNQLHKQPASRKKVRTTELEGVLKQSYGEIGAYQKAGGYVKLCAVMAAMVAEGRLEPARSAKGNGRIPELSTLYWSLPERPTCGWPEMEMVRLSDRLNLAGYVRQPALQTKEELERIERVYRFLQHREDREWATREERSLELFGHEKWLSEDRGLQFLRRLGLTLDELRAKVHGEPFVFWPRPGANLQEAGEALVVENLSLFHSIRRVLEQNGQALGLRPDLLIYGEGKKIEASLSFLTDITDAAAVQINYAGDIDPEGWGIYSRLKQKYVELRIRLALPFYEAMVRSGQTVPIVEGQMQDPVVIGHVLDELQRDGGSEELLDAVNRCWHSRLRIPQEVLTVETMRGGAREAAAGGVSLADQRGLAATAEGGSDG